VPSNRSRHRAAAWLPIVLAGLAAVGCRENAITGPVPNGKLPAAETRTISAPSLSTLRATRPTISSTCGTATTWVLSDGTRTVGSVSVDNDASNIYVTYAVPTQHWWLSDSRLAVAKSASAIPKDDTGQPSPWDFTLAQTHEPPVTSFTYTVPISSVGVGTGQTAYIAAFAGVVHPVVESNYEGSWEWIVMWGLTSQSSTETIHSYTIQACAGQPPIPPAPTVNGIVTLTFDDGFKTTWDNVYPVLRDLGLKGNIAVNPTPIDEGWSDYMTLGNLNSLWAAGWSIVSHTMDHPDLTTLTPEAMEAEIRDSKAWVQAKGFGPTNVFIVPFHAWGERERAVIQKYHTYARGHTIDEFWPELFQAVPITQPMDLTAFEPEFAPYKTDAGRKLTMDKVKYAVENGYFLDLMFHRVPAAQVENFKTLMTEIAAYKANVKTWKEVAQ
jgi:peptidoglycan/xylan/chitin deacetylase (PgdA/CDA1 family)